MASRLKLRSKLKYNLLIISLALVSLVSNISAGQNCQANTNAQATPKEKTDLCAQVHKQTNTISLILQELIEAVNNRTIKVKDKDDTIKNLTTINNFILDQKRNSSLQNTSAERDLAYLLSTNKLIINQVLNFLKNNLNKIKFNSTNIIKNSREISCFDHAYLQLLANENDKNLAYLTLKTRQTGFSLLNRVVRRSEVLVHNFGIGNFIRRITPYALLTGLLIHITPEAEFADGSILKQIKKRLKGLPFGSETPSPVTPAGTSDSKAAVDSKATGEKAKAYNLGGLVSIKRDPVEFGAMTLFFTTIVKRDLEDIYGWFAEKGNHILTVLKGENYESPSPLKSYKTVFADIFGYQDVKNELEYIINYIKQKEAHDRAGTYVDRGIVFAGPVDIGKLFVQALCGEINKELKAIDKDPDCGIYEIHASKLVTKSIDDIIKEIEKEASLDAPAILYIENIDWLYTNAKKKAEVWSALINAMNRNLRGSKKQIYIIATVSDLKNLDENLNVQGRFSRVIQFDKPTLVNRMAYFMRELKNRGANPDNFNLERLAIYTSNCSYNKLEAIIKHAFSQARSESKLINESHLEESIDRLTYHIIKNAHYRSDLQLRILANHYAGQAIAHKIINPRHQKLMKATIYPVGSNGDSQNISQGAVFTNNSMDDISTQDLKNEIAILLSGIEAQKQLNDNNQPVVSLLDEVRVKVLALAKRVVLYNSELSEDIKQKKLAQALELIEQCTQEAASLVSRNRNHVTALSDALVSKRIVTDSEINRLMQS